MIALHDVDLRQAAAEAADHGVAEVQQPLGHRADVHQLRREDEQRHGEDDVVGIHAVEQLLGGGAHVEAGEQQIEDRAGDHGVADRQPEEGERGDRDDRRARRGWRGSYARPRLGRVELLRRLAAMACQASHR